MSEIKSIILAAGKGTRMKSETPKVLHKIFEKPLLGYVLDNVKNIVNESFVIVGHHAEEVTEFVQKNYSSAKTVLQSPQLGTGHAVSMVCPYLKDFKGQAQRWCLHNFHTKILRENRAFIKPQQYYLHFRRSPQNANGYRSEAKENRERIFYNFRFCKIFA